MISIFLRLACQNILRRPTRTLMLILAVALVSGAIFASFIVGRGIQASMERSFAQMGADLVVVPADAMVNITSALLTVQPTDSTLSTNLLKQIGSLHGVEKIAAQTIYRIPMMVHMPEHKANLIAFDPASDFTVMPWLQTKLPRVMKAGDLIAGARRDEAIGEELEPCATTATVYGKLARSGVGPLDDSLFATYDTAAYLAQGKIAGVSTIPTFDRQRCSAIFVRLAFGTTPEQMRFAISQIAGVKVITGATIVTSTRQTTSALLSAMLVFATLILLGSLIVVGLLFSAIIGERRREIGVLSAIGSKQADIVKMLLAEACFTTGLGGVAGIIFGAVLLLIFQRSLVYYLETLHIDFIWPALSEMAYGGAACAVLAMLGGLLGALIPALRASAEEPYRMMQDGG